MNDYTELDKFIESLRIEYTTEFVPFSKSRNAVDNPKLNDLSLNWVVTLKKGNMKLSTDYMQGIGHLPVYVQGARSTIAYYEVIKFACEDGNLGRWGDAMNRVVPLKSYSKFDVVDSPLLRDVLWS